MLGCVEHSDIIPSSTKHAAGVRVQEARIFCRAPWGTPGPRATSFPDHQVPLLEGAARTQGIVTPEFVHL